MITGGARSGKSSLALQLSLGSYSHRAFVATAEPFDEEMAERARVHQAERGSEFLTVEEPFEISTALMNLPANIEVAVIDCLTVWLGNVFYRVKDDPEQVKPHIDFLVACLDKVQLDLIFVTNEVGWGIIPETRLSREYRDLAGYLNRIVAARADTVALCVCGIPLTLKGSW